jgi:hypothetical protein
MIFQLTPFLLYMHDYKEYFSSIESFLYGLSRLIRWIICSGVPKESLPLRPYLNWIITLTGMPYRSGVHHAFRKRAVLANTTPDEESNRSQPTHLRCRFHRSLWLPSLPRTAPQTRSWGESYPRGSPRQSPLKSRCTGRVFPLQITGLCTRNFEYVHTTSSFLQKSSCIFTHPLYREANLHWSDVADEVVIKDYCYIATM